MRRRGAWLLCAWVLWSHETGTGNERWDVNVGVGTFAECQALQKESTRTRNALRSAMTPTGGFPLRDYVVWLQKTDEVGLRLEDARGGVRYVCLPDTVDPRGPKR